MNGDQIGRGRLIQVMLLGWLAMLGVDFLLHAGLLARLYVEPTPFLLPADQAFRLIPLGYLAFLLLSVLLVWLMARLEISGRTEGFLFGLKLGGLTWGALILGLASISTAPLNLLLAWWLGQSVELGVGGAAIAEGLSAARMRTAWLRVAVFAFLLVAGTIVIQTVRAVQ